MLSDVEEEQFGVTIRTKRIRAAHRGGLINQLDDSLTSAQLKQLKQSLLGKLDILSKLDGEIVLHVEEEQLENEIKHADGVREKAELAIIQELAKLARPQLAQLPTRVMKVTAPVNIRPSLPRLTHRGTRLP